MRTRTFNIIGLLLIAVACTVTCSNVHANVRKAPADQTAYETELAELKASVIE